jgi:hypothetical protein
MADTAVLPRNFTLTADERVRAVMAGPPAYVRRRRHIEDLEGRLLAAIAGCEGLAPEDAAALLRWIEHQLERLGVLVVDHNRYYPVEANLPLDPRTGEMIDGRRPWAPMPLPTLESLRARAIELWGPSLRSG